MSIHKPSISAASTQRETMSLATSILHNSSNTFRESASPMKSVWLIKERSIVRRSLNMSTWVASWSKIWTSTGWTSRRRRSLWTKCTNWGSKSRAPFSSKTKTTSKLFFCISTQSDKVRTGRRGLTAIQRSLFSLPTRNSSSLLLAIIWTGAGLSGNLMEASGWFPLLTSYTSASSRRPALWLFFTFSPPPSSSDITHPAYYYKEIPSTSWFSTQHTTKNRSGWVLC